MSNGAAPVRATTVREWAIRTARVSERAFRAATARERWFESEPRA